MFEDFSEEFSDLLNEESFGLFGENSVEDEIEINDTDMEYETTINEEANYLLLDPDVDQSNNLLFVILFVLFLGAVSMMIHSAFRTMGGLDK